MIRLRAFLRFLNLLEPGKNIVSITKVAMWVCVIAFAYLTIGGSLSADSTNGLIDAESFCCDHCGDRMSQDEYYWVNSGRHTEEQWCESCENNHAIYCEHEEITVSEDCAVSLDDGGYASEWYFNAHGWTCEGTGGNYLGDEYVTLEDGTMWSLSYFEDHGATCEITGEHHPSYGPKRSWSQRRTSRN